MIQEGGSTPESRMAYGFQLIVSRTPTPQEMQVLLEGLSEDRARFASDSDAAKKLAAFGDSQVGEALDIKELAAYTLSANVLLNLDEFVTKE